ncbi:MAG: hypothetical protein KDB79_01245 [Acidobacteria bacterium]|nr:hypothetical protein [Acidobacteriota bacterium]
MIDHLARERFRKTSGFAVAGRILRCKAKKEADSNLGEVLDGSTEIPPDLGFRKSLN